MQARASVGREKAVRWWRARGVGLLIALVLAGGVPQPGSGAQATPTPHVNRIAFSFEGEIWSMNVDGTDRTRLTDSPGEDFSPSWSPDGSRIAFRTQRDGNDEIYLMNADGSEEMNLTNDPASDWSPVWSPDGSLIAFSSQRPGDSTRNIYLVNPDGTDLTNLTQDTTEGEYPTWSPDGTRLAFGCYQGGGTSSGTRPNYDICVINRDGTGLANLTNHPAYDMYPAWSSDGATIAIDTERDACPDGTISSSEEVCEDGSAIYLIDPNGINPRLITTPVPGGNRFPAWSPDGSRLAFTRSGLIVTTNPDGSNLQDLGPGAFPTWSPIV